MVFVLGVTGGIGSGKTAVTDRFATHGIETVDADVIAKQVVAPGSKALQEISIHFGQNILSINGELNREALRQQVFNNPDEKQWLEALLHPLIRQEIVRQLNQAQPPYVILSAPLLLETDAHTLADRILVIDCDEAVQVSRTVERDNSSPQAIEKIIQQQISRKERLQRADDIIVNNGTLEELHRAVDNYHENLVNKI